MKRIIVDLDDTISFKKSTYADAKVNSKLCSKLREYQKNGFEIVIHTARNMRTYEGNIGKINVNTIPVIIQWLKKNDVPYDELIVGKPWCGFEGFYIDDKAIRPNEFINLSYSEIKSLIS